LLKIKSVDLGRGISITAGVSQEQRLTEEKIRTTYVESAGDDVANTATLS
jgi:transketolase N-terminal domain/subunit